jgi:hypothetical protein
LLKAGQNILLNNRLWHVRQVSPLTALTWQLEVMGVSAAALGLTRQMSALRYGDQLFIQSRPPQYWRGHLQHDWVDTERGPALNCQPAIWLDLLNAHTCHPTADLKNQFSWSYSRAAKYRQCPRAYYYHYYAAWGGWQPHAPEPVQQAYLLKNLTDLPRWIGTLVHDSLKFALARLRAGQPVSPANLLNQMRARAEADLDNSHSGRFQQQPQQFTGFQEDYYQEKLPPSAWAEAVQQAEQQLQIFLQSSLYANLRHHPPTAFLKVEEMQSFSLAQTRIWVQLDLALRQDRSIDIYDWKTGEIEPDEAKRQLALYGLYLRHSRPQTAGVSLRGVVYLLRQDHWLEFYLDETVLSETQTWAEASIAQLQGLLLDITANLADQRRFPMINDLAACRRCQFRELCGRSNV